MPINLIKGQRVDMGSLLRLKVTMGWRVNPDARPPYDLDASAFLLGAEEKIEYESDFVFYGSPNQLTVTMPDGTNASRPISKDESVLGAIDDRGDDEDTDGRGEEELEVDLSHTEQRVKEILFTASIYWTADSPSRFYNFGQVRDAYIQIEDMISGNVICRYDLDEDFSTMKGVVFGRLYRRGDIWRFEAVGEGFADGLEPICRRYAPDFM